MSDHVSIKIDGLEELRAKLRDPQRIRYPLYMLFKEATDIGKEAATEAIDGGTGIAVRSIAARIRPMDAEVYTNIARPRALSIEEGRQAGENPRAILPGVIRWKESISHPETGIEIAVEIARRGSKGKGYMANAAEKIREALPRLMNELSERIKGAFRK